MSAFALLDLLLLRLSFFLFVSVCFSVHARYPETHSFTHGPVGIRGAQTPLFTCCVGGA